MSAWGKVESNVFMLFNCKDHLLSVADGSF